MKKKVIFIYLFILSLFSSKYISPSKIVGLIGVRNEEIMIKQCLQALSLYVDAIVILDDASTDKTLDIIYSLKDTCKVERIIEKKSWFRDEPGDRNALLNTGRKIGGTHFISLDADEIFSANCLENNYLRDLVLSLNPGDSLDFPFTNLWRSIKYYRNDSSVWSPHRRTFIFCDDGKGRLESGFIHCGRCPANLSGQKKIAHDMSKTILHFQFVNWRNLLIKQAWYRCLEIIRNPSKSIIEINSVYGQSKDERNIQRSKCPKKWFDGYDFFDPSIFSTPEKWREEEVLSWFDQYGKNFFEKLDIWDVDWGNNFGQ
ncbi:MAG: glycosyltransferase family 2 protein [Candidatus Babeliaceae bacterium]|nr:glycosyltransferase family 2 protein [Candidatus Babeliaceae bacterium]